MPLMNRKRLTVRLAHSLYGKLTAACDDSGIDVNTAITRALTHALESDRRLLARPARKRDHPQNERAV